MAQERKPKRQRFSLGGPSGDTSFEDYLTGTHKTISSDEEEEFDQENQDPEEEFDEDEEDEEFDEEEEEEEENDYDLENQHAPALNTTTNTTTTNNTQDTINKIHISQNLTTNSSAKNINFLIQIHLVLPSAKVPVTRLLHLPSTLLFEQFSSAIQLVFDWEGDHLWKFDLQTPPQITTTTTTTTIPKDIFPHPRYKVTDIKDMMGLHNLGTNDFRKDLDSKKIRLMDIWGKHQVPRVRKLDMFYTYDCYGDAWYHRIKFLGVAEEGLKPVDLGVEVEDRQQRIWCFGGSGAARPEDMGDEEEQERWEEENDTFEWDIGWVNAGLSEVDVVWLPGM